MDVFPTSMAGPGAVPGSGMPSGLVSVSTATILYVESFQGKADAVSDMKLCSHAPSHNHVTRFLAYTQMPRATCFFACMQLPHVA